jgi:hypothetical protein
VIYSARDLKNQLITQEIHYPFSQEYVRSFRRDYVSHAFPMKPGRSQRNFSLAVLLVTAWVILFCLELIIPVSYWADSAALDGTLILGVISFIQLIRNIAARRREPDRSKIWLWGGILIISVALVLAAIPIRMEALARAVRRARPLIDRIDAFVEKNGRSPRDIGELGVDARDLTKTGIPACPSFRYTVGGSETSSHLPGLTSMRLWSMSMPCNLLPGFHIYYGPVEHCPEFYRCSDGWVLRRP